VRFGWVGGPRGYGQRSGLLFALADAGHTFLIDVHKSLVIYEVNPPAKNPRTSSRGRNSRRLD